MGLLRRRPDPAESVGVCFCGCATAETDRSGRAGHRACIDRVLATVARESYPYDDAGGVAGFLAEETALAADLSREATGGRL